MFWVMKKIAIQIFLFVFLYSCGNDRNPNLDTTGLKNDIIDSTLSINKDTILDTTIIESKETNKEIIVVEKESKNILEIEEKKSDYKIKSISELWKQYKFAKEKATKFSSSNNLDSIIIYLSIASDAAYELSREDIATWQLNNIGYYSINEFKRRTDYEKRMQKLATFTDLKKKVFFATETKSVFRKNFEILIRAQKYLQKAQILDSELEKSERTDIINSNLQFIEWIEEYISNGKRVNEENEIE